MSNGGKFFFGFAIGAAIGAAVGFLVTTDREKLVEQIKKTADDVKDYVKKNVPNFSKNEEIDLDVVTGDDL